VDGGAGGAGGTSREVVAEGLVEAMKTFAIALIVGLLAWTGCCVVVSYAIWSRL